MTSGSIVRQDQSFCWLLHADPARKVSGIPYVRRQRVVREARSLAGHSLDRAIATIDVIENNVAYVNQKPMGEPKLGDYGLYSGIGGTSAGGYQMALLWLLNMSDGTASLLDIAERSGLPWDILKQAAVALSIGRSVDATIGQLAPQNISIQDIPIADPIRRLIHCLSLSLAQALMLITYQR